MLHLAHAYILHTVNVNPCHYNHLIFFLSSLLINQQTTSQNRSRSWSVLEWFPRKSPRMKRGARASFRTAFNWIHVSSPIWSSIHFGKARNPFIFCCSISASPFLGNRINSSFIIPFAAEIEIRQRMSDFLTQFFVPTKIVTGL